MPKTNNNEAFLFVTPVLGAKFYCFTNSTPYLLRVHFLTPFWGSPYLVLFGVKLTVLGHNLEKYENSEKLSGRPPPAKIITLLIVCRQLSPENTSSFEKSNSLLLKTLKTPNSGNFHENLNFPHFRSILHIRVQNLLSEDYPKISSFSQEYWKKLSTAPPYALNLTNKPLVFK